MLGFRLLRCNVIRLKSCALTSPVSTASLLTSCCRRYIHCTPSTSVQSYSSKQFNKFGDRNKKSQMQIKQRKRKYKRPPKSSSRKNLYNELIKSGIERFQTLQRTDICEMDLHKIIEWLELSEVPTVNTALYDHVLKLLYSKSFHPNQYTQKELAMLLSLGGVEYNTAAVPPTLQQRKEYVSEFLEVLKEKGAKLGIDLWNTKYLADFENSLKIDVLQILEDLSQKNLEPNIQTYELITKIYASKGKFYEITEVIEHMKDLKILVTPKILENFVYASTLVGGSEAIKGNLKKFLSSNELGPLDQSRLYLAMARAYSKQGELEDIIKLISARASLIHSIKEKPRESREKKAVDEVDNAKLLEICYNLMNRQEKDVIKAIKPFMKKFDNGYYFYIYRKQIDMKAVEYYEKKRDFETSIQLLSLIGTYPPGLFMIAGLVSKDLTNNKINIDDIIKYSEILRENIDYKWPLAFFINEFHKYRLDQPLDKQKRSNQKFNRLIRTFFASDEYKEISQAGNRRILEEIHMWLQERSFKTKNADQNKLLDTIDAYTPLEEIALAQTRRRFIALPKRRVEIFSPENTVPPEPEVILNKLPELLALKALKEKLKETTILAQKHEEKEKQNTPVVLKNETTSDMLAKLGTEKAINEKSKRQMSQISKKQQFKEKSAQKVQERGVLFENPAIYDNIRTQEKSARALNDKQLNIHPQNLDHKNKAQQQGMPQKSTEEDPTELKLLVQEANRLKAMYREDPKSVDPLSIAQIYAFILEERAKKQPPFPFAIYLGIKDFFSLNLDQHQRDSIKTDFPKWMEIAVENAVKNEQYGLMERLMKIRSKHGVQVSPKTMLLYAQNVQKRVPEEQEKIALVEKEKIILEEKVSLQKQVKRVQQIAQAPKSKTLKSRGVLVRKYAKKSLKSPTTPQKVPISKKFIVEEPDFSEPSADESIEKLAQIEESKENVQERVPKRRPSATKLNAQEVKLKQKLESITQTPMLQEIRVSQQKPVSELPRKVLIDKLSDTPIEKVQEKSSLENFIEDLSKDKIFSGYKKEKEAQEEKQKLVSHWPPPQEEVDKSARLRKEKEEIYKLIENAQLDEAFAKIQPYVKESKNYHITMDLLSAAIKHDNTQLLSQLQTEYRSYPIANSSTFQISMAIALLENGKPSEANLILENKKLIFSRGIMAALTSREVHLNRPDVLHKMFLRFYKSEGTSPMMMLTMIHPIIRLYDTKQDLDGLISLKSDLQRLDCPIHTDVDLLFNMTIDRLKSKNNLTKEDPPNEPKELPETQNFQQDISTEPIFSRIQEKLKSQGQSNMSPNFDLNLNPQFYPYKILPPGVMENSYREARRPYSLMFQMSKDGKDEQF